MLERRNLEQTAKYTCRYDMIFSAVCLSKSPFTIPELVKSLSAIYQQPPHLSMITRSRWSIEKKQIRYFPIGAIMDTIASRIDLIFYS